MSAFTLLNNNQIVIGPRDWNPKYFEYFLKQEFNIDNTLPEDTNFGTLVFNDSVRIVPTQFTMDPTIDSLFEVLAGPQFSFDEYGNHFASYVAEELPIETVKHNLKMVISNNRYIKETTPITRDINGKIITIYTNRESRVTYVQALLMADEFYSSNWKFAEGFVTINKLDLQSIGLLNSYFQLCFDWESNKFSEIDSKETVSDLRLINIVE